MVIAGIPREEIRHTRAVQDWLAEGRQEGLVEGEALADALLDFTSPDDLATWLAANSCTANA